MKIHSIAQINVALENVSNVLTDWIQAQDGSEFEISLNGEKWSTGQHLEHLIRSTKPLNTALRVPKFILKSKFGKKNDRPEKTFEQLVERYKERLGEGGKAVGEFIPPDISNAQKEDLIKTFGKEIERVIKAFAKWNEDDVSVFILPHPLLGKLTVREMMFFTIYHTTHHFNLIKRDYGKKEQKS